MCLWRHPIALDHRSDPAFPSPHDRLRNEESGEVLSCRLKVPLNPLHQHGLLDIGRAKEGYRMG